MKVGILFLDGREYRPSEFDRLQRSSAWERLSVGIALNTRAMLHFNSEHENQHNEVVGIGNVTESALLNFLYCRGIDYRTIQNDWNLIFELEHNSQRKMSLTAGRMGMSLTSSSRGRRKKYCDVVPLSSPTRSKYRSTDREMSSRRFFSMLHGAHIGYSRLPKKENRQMISEIVKPRMNGSNSLISD